MATAQARLAEIKTKHPNANIYPPTGYGTNVHWILIEDPSHYEFLFPSTVAQQSRMAEPKSPMDSSLKPALAATALAAGIAAASKFLKRRERVAREEGR
jgi:hypothetical protein